MPYDFPILSKAISLNRYRSHAIIDAMEGQAAMKGGPAENQGQKGRGSMEDLLSYNREFVRQKRYEGYKAGKRPKRKLAILTCMDTRLTTLLPAALGLRNGDAIILKNAGGIASDPVGGEIRSLLIAIYELGVERVLVLGHTDCGVQGLTPERMERSMRARGVSEQEMDRMRPLLREMRQQLCGFEQVEQSVRDSVSFLREHPLIPGDVELWGMVIDSATGELTPV